MDVILALFLTVVGASMAFVVFVVVVLFSSSLHFPEWCVILVV
jgi:hypothetical protein